MFTFITLFHHLYIWCTRTKCTEPQWGWVGCVCGGGGVGRPPYRKYAKCYSFAKVKCLFTYRRRSTMAPFSLVPLSLVSKTQFSPSVLWALVLLQCLLLTPSSCWFTESCWSRLTSLSKVQCCLSFRISSAGGALCCVSKLSWNSWDCHVTFWMT